MVQDSFPHGGQVTGDAASTDLFWAPYTDDMFSDWVRKLFQLDRTVQGVVGGYANELQVTDGGGTTMRVATGAALVDGKFYENTANVDNVSSGNAVYWLVGLTKSWAAQTVRIFARGTYASEAAALAALVQNDGTTWEIALATVLTTAGGDVDVVTDQREWVMRVATRRLFVPCVSVYNLTDAGDENRTSFYGWKMPDAKDCFAHGDFMVPLDCKSGTNLTVKAVLEATGNGDIYRYHNYRAIEGCGVAGTDEIGTGLGAEALAVNNVTYCIAEFTISNVEPGWYYGLEFERDATDPLDTIGAIVYLKGFTVEYTPIVP